MAHEERRGDSNGSVVKTAEKKPKFWTRRTQYKETPEQRAERRRYKAERERIRRRENRLRKERELEMLNSAFRTEEVRPSSLEVNSMSSHSIAAGVLQTAKAQVSQRELVSSMSKGK
ncbi:hypothetical protein TELCIR_16287 [Teladorsagia circumcincta]|uniref:Uncharacterized protein n=1 Tax=Teladorsagia circumcincta TaxID=45464 RepID=A0A2G9TVW4_TELCI|nr:hypothetical protein TELCIR_16287 [Teladorsagia circumcincta]